MIEKWDEGSAVETQDFAACHRSNSKDLFAILRRHRKDEIQGPIRQLHRLWLSLKWPAPLGQSPQTVPAIAKAGKQEILSVRSPSPAAFARLRIPVGKERMRAAPVAVEFPQCGRGDLDVPDRDPELASVRRDRQGFNSRWQAGEFRGVGAVRFCLVNVIVVDKEQVLAIRCPYCGMQRNRCPQRPRWTRRQREKPG